jgi:hypothetical protein
MASASIDAGRRRAVKEKHPGREEAPDPKLFWLPSVPPGIIDRPPEERTPSGESG